MPTLINGLRMWPGGSLVSGNITDGGPTATGSVASWAPSFPYTEADPPTDDSTFLDLTVNGKGWDAMNVMAFLKAGASGPHTVTANVWIALLFPIAGADGVSATYWPQIVQVAWGSDSAKMKTWANVGPFPTGAKTMNTPSSYTLTNYFRPPCYPRNNVAAAGNNIATNGYASNFAVETIEADDPMLMAKFTIPLGGATGALYRVNLLTATGANLTSLDFRLGAELLRSEL